jgi:hypothetical protein
MAVPFSGETTYPSAAFTITPVHLLPLTTLPLDVVVLMRLAVIQLRVDFVFIRNTFLPVVYELDIACRDCVTPNLQLIRRHVTPMALETRIHRGPLGSPQVPQSLQIPCPFLGLYIGKVDFGQVDLVNLALSSPGMFSASGRGMGSWGGNVDTPR